MGSEHIHPEGRGGGGCFWTDTAARCSRYCVHLQLVLTSVLNVSRAFRCHQQELSALTRCTVNSKLRVHHLCDGFQLLSYTRGIENENNATFLCCKYNAAVPVPSDTAAALILNASGEWLTLTHSKTNRRAHRVHTKRYSCSHMKEDRSHGDETGTLNN